MLCCFFLITDFFRRSIYYNTGMLLFCGFFFYREPKGNFKSFSRLLLTYIMFLHLFHYSMYNFAGIFKPSHGDLCIVQPVCKGLQGTMELIYVVQMLIHFVLEYISNSFCSCLFYIPVNPHFLLYLSYVIPHFTMYDVYNLILV